MRHPRDEGHISAREGRRGLQHRRQRAFDTCSLKASGKSLDDRTMPRRNAPAIKGSCFPQVCFRFRSNSRGSKLTWNSQDSTE
eukprot:1148073-Pelagomonas_calceolata.AAC.12